MFVVRAAKDWFLLLTQHWKAALPAFLAAILVYLGIAAVWPKHYTASALVELNPEVNWKADLGSQRDTATAAVRQATTPADWAAIVTRLHLFPETVADGRLDWAASYLASQVSIQQTEDAKHSGVVVRIEYTNSERDAALGVSQAVADNLTRPVSLLSLGNLATAPALLPKVNAAAAPQDVSPVARQMANAPAKVIIPVRNESKRRMQSSAPAPELTRRLQAGIAEGQILQDAFNENTQTINSLRQQLAVEDKKAAAAQQAPRPAVERKGAVPKPDPQIEHLREELARSEQALAGLQQRYTDDYPDVVAAKERVRDILLDMNRVQTAYLASARTQAPMPAAKPPATPPFDPAVRNELVRRLNESQAAEEKLQEDIEHNQAEVARLRLEVALSRNASAPSVPAPEDAGSTAAAPASATSPLAQAPSPPVVPPQPSSASLSSASPPLETDLPSPAGSSSSIPVSTPMSLAESATVRTSPVIFAGRLAWMLSVALGCAAALAAALLAERRDPSIRGERMLRHELPPSTVFLGRIPRVRHETVPR